MAIAGCVAAPMTAATAQDGRYAMGTALEATVLADTEAEARAGLEEVFDLVARLESLLTIFDPESEVSRLNARAGETPRAVDPRLARILSDARSYTALTRGAFDVSVGPLIALWTEASRSGRLPTEQALDRARARVGAEGIVVDATGAVGLSRPGMAIDLGGLAKGWALDRAREALTARGVTAAFVSFGQSSILALGEPEEAPPGSGWRVLVRNPDPDASAGSYAGIATLREGSLSVSSSFGAWSEIEGRRYGHVLDPRSGRPMTRAAQAVVLARSGALAEALSKALLVLEPAEAIDLLESQEGVEGLLIPEGGDTRATSGFAAATSWRPLTGSEPAADAPR